MNAPFSLLLLVHLHLLDYTYVNQPQYDNHIFDPRHKGLRERMKMMEDICYFLVAQLETNPKLILPTYPCSIPVDSLAFRISLFKFLENLRQGAFPSQKVFPNAKRSPNSKGDALGKTAWWWKDVVIRKSLLEECAGAKFQRLLLAFSIHVFSRKTGVYTRNELYGLVTTTPVAYNNNLVEYQNRRQEWVLRSHSLLRRQEGVPSLRHTLSLEDDNVKLESLTHVVNQKRDGAYARFQDRMALAYFMRLAGIIMPSSTASSEASTNTLTSHVVPKRVYNQAWVGSHSAHALTGNQQCGAHLLPLPIAAAHHPNNLQQVRRSVFIDDLNNESCSHNIQHGDNKDRSDFPNELLFVELLSEKKRYQELAETLITLHTKRQLLSRTNTRRRGRLGLKFNFGKLQFTSAEDLLRVPRIDDSLIHRLSLSSYREQWNYDGRIQYIQESILPQYPPKLDTELPHVVPDKTMAVPANTIATMEELQKKQFLKLKTMETNTIQTHSNLHQPKPILADSLAQRMKEEERINTEIDDIATRIILVTEDNSTENIPIFETPRSRPPIKRIWTSGQKKRPVKTPRQFDKLILPEPSIQLPVIAATSTGSMILPSLENDLDIDSHLLSVESNRGRTSRSSNIDDGEISQRSITLREMLLAVDTTDYLLDDSSEYLEELSGWE